MSLSLLDRIPSMPPPVAPVTEDNRPVWSVMIPVYNAGNYLREAIKSVLVQAQSAELMQIEVVDDGSTDQNVEQLVREIGNGRVSYYRQPFNVGSLQNFHSCLIRARGKLIHLLHADDFVNPGFYDAMEKLLKEYPEAGAGFCRYQYVNEKSKVLYSQAAELDKSGILKNWLCTLGTYQRIQYVSMVVRREVYEKLGSFYGVEYGEDWEMWMRIAYHYPIAYTPELLASYRLHTNSITGKRFSTAQNIEELKWVMNVIQKYLPEEKRAQVLKASKKFYAQYAVKTGKNLWVKQFDEAGARAQMSAGWRLHKSFSLLIEIVKLRLRLMLNL